MSAGRLAVFLLLPAIVWGQGVRVRLETEAGNLDIDVAADSAPITAANFLYYVDEGFYDGGSFHRTVKSTNQPKDRVKIEVIQAGINPSRKGEEGAPISLERTSKTGLRHLNGAVSMARRAPDTATSEFFICIDDQPELDFGGKRNPDGQGFAVFGWVVNGMDVVKKIQQAPAQGQNLTPPIRIVKAYLVEE